MDAEKAGRAADYLTHIAEAIERIQDYTRGMDEASFSAARLEQDAVIRNLSVLGEASKNLQRHAPVLCEANPGLQASLRAAYAMRNRLDHGYYEVRLSLVWETVQRDLPPLLALVRKLIPA